MTDRHAVEHDAAAWLLRIREPEFDDWDDWDRWLAADARHAEVYWRMAEQDAGLADPDAAEKFEPLTASVTASPDVPRDAPRARPAPARRPRSGPTAGRPSRRLWLATAVAASVAIVSGVIWTTLASRPAVLETAPGAAQSFTLADGSRAHLAGGTRLALTRDGRRVELENGRVVFEVTHDAANPFVVGVGEATVTDLGTVFDVTRFDDGLRVAVAEGVVRYDGEAGSETLQAGEAIAVQGRDATRGATSAEAVAGWRTGRLTWRDEPLSRVAEDLARAMGRPVMIEPAIAARPFSGSLMTTGSETELRARTAALLGVAVRTEGAGWRLQAATTP